MKIKPAFNYLLIELNDGRQTDTIIVPNNVQPLLPYGLVMALGPEVKDFSVGDKVLFDPRFATAVSSPDESPKILLNASQVMACYVADSE